MQIPQTIVPFVKSQDGLRAEVASADLGLDPLSMDAGNYARHGTDHGIFIDGNDILANDGENLAQIDHVDGGISVKQSKIEDIAAHVASDALEEYDGSIEDRLNALRSELRQAILDGDASVIDELEREVARLEELIDTEKLRVPQVLAGDGITITSGATPAGDPTQTVSVKVASPDSGLGADSNGMFVRVKDGGGILRDVYGLSIDKSIIDDEIDDKLRIELGEYVKRVFIGEDKKLHVIDRCGEETIYDIDVPAKGNVIIDGYVAGSGSFDDDGNCHITVTPNISATPTKWYVGKTNAMDKWGEDENGNMWGSTADHPFASLSYAIDQTNKHTFPGNYIEIDVIDGGLYNDRTFVGISVTSNTTVQAAASSRPMIRGSYEISLANNCALTLSGLTFKCPIATTKPNNGQTFFRTFGTGTIAFNRECRMIIDNDNFGVNSWGFITMYDNTELSCSVYDGKTGLFLELENAGTTVGGCIRFSDRSCFSAVSKDAEVPNIVFNAPAGTKIQGYAVHVGRCNTTDLFNAANVHEGTRFKFWSDWNIADDSELEQAYLHPYSYLGLRKNDDKGQALPGHGAGFEGAGAEFYQAEW